MTTHDDATLDELEAKHRPLQPGENTTASEPYCPVCIVSAPCPVAQTITDLRQARQRKTCGICGQETLTRNPHPDAGKPERYLEVGAEWECIPCLRTNRHNAHELHGKVNKLEAANTALRTALEELADEADSAALSAGISERARRDLLAQVLAAREVLKEE